jgi:hypothetical protein
MKKITNSSMDTDISMKKDTNKDTDIKFSISPSSQLWNSFRSLFHHCVRVEQIGCIHTVRSGLELNCSSLLPNTVSWSNTTEGDFLWNNRTITPQYVTGPGRTVRYVYGMAIVSWIGPMAPGLSDCAYLFRLTRFKYCEDANNNFMLLPYRYIYKSKIQPWR